MRKHNEGYSMVLVLVVLTVICLVATALMSFSVSNLRNQESSVKQMQDRYTAEGAAEQITAQLKNEYKEFEGKHQMEGMGELPKIDFDGIVISDDEGTVEVRYLVSSEDMTVQYEIVSGTNRIDMTLRLNADKMEKTAGENEYSLTGWKGVECISYDISRVSEEVTPE